MVLSYKAPKEDITLYLIVRGPHAGRWSGTKIWNCSAISPEEISFLEARRAWELEHCNRVVTLTES